MVAYVATLDIPRHVVDHLSRPLAAHRRQTGTLKGSRALGPFRQAVLVLRWFRERGCVHCPARDAGVSQATGYRYLHEGIDVLAAQAPDLHQVLDQCRREGMTHVILDGTLVETDRLAGVRDNGNDLWFSQTQGVRRQRPVPGRPDGTRCASPTSNPAPPPASPPPASTRSPPCTRWRPTACPPWPTRATSAPASAASSRSAARRASQNRPCTPTRAPPTA
ncbi:hypothetical protein ACR6C2_22000 [Streptomyces sp. INA 01156]